MSARVLEPPNYNGNILEGEVREIRAGAAGGKPAYAQFDFHTLHQVDKVLPVSASLVRAINSRSQSEWIREAPRWKRAVVMLPEG